MDGRRRIRWWTALATLIVALVPCAVGADEAAPPAVLARLAGDPRLPDAYTADVELHIKLHVFPYVGLTVHGTSDYRRPGSYHFVLRGVPKIAGKFDDLRYDLGDPLQWPQRYEIAAAPECTAETPVVRLTPKAPKGQVLYLEVQTDATSGRLLRATWTRRDGGTIVLTQTYGNEGKADVVVAQHAVIAIPHMRADLDATYSNIVLVPSTLAGVPAER